jgi:hypothetical protein
MEDMSWPVDEDHSAEDLPVESVWVAAERVGGKTPDGSSRLGTAGAVFGICYDHQR